MIDESKAHTIQNIADIGMQAGMPPRLFIPKQLLSWAGSPCPMCR